MGFSCLLCLAERVPAVERQAAPGGVAAGRGPITPSGANGCLGYNDPQPPSHPRVPAGDSRSPQHHGGGLGRRSRLGLEQRVSSSGPGGLDVGGRRTRMKPEPSTDRFSGKREWQPLASSRGWRKFRREVVVTDCHDLPVDDCIAGLPVSPAGDSGRRNGPRRPAGVVRRPVPRACSRMGCRPHVVRRGNQDCQPARASVPDRSRPRHQSGCCAAAVLAPAGQPADRPPAAGCRCW